MLTVRCRSSNFSERRYITQVIMQDFLGVEYRLSPTLDPEDARWVILAEGTRTLILPDEFLGNTGVWLKHESLPQPSVREWLVDERLTAARTVESSIPLLYHNRLAAQIYTAADETAWLQIDVFGSAFLLLTGYEELVDHSQDEHGRPAAGSTIAARFGVQHRPIINEYAELLGAAINRFWPRCERPVRRSRIFLSHDVDWPTCSIGQPVKALARAVAGDVLCRGDLSLAANRILSYARTRKNKESADMGNTFDYLLDVSERHGLSSAFYFMAGGDHPLYDPPYRIHSPWLRSVVRRIYDRGHELGFHPSYLTYNCQERAQRELQRLTEAFGMAGIAAVPIGGRQHFLRWENPATWRIWNTLGLRYDSTLGFANGAGFRNGTCYEYRVYDVLERRALQLRERPLVVMDCAVLGDRQSYASDAYDVCVKYAATCRQFDGDFTLLWHNSRLLTGAVKRLYADIVFAIA
jgi:hypothetical protein